MNLKIHIIIVLFALVVYKTIEPLVYCMVYLQHSTEINNILEENPQNQLTGTSCNDSFIEQQSINTSKGVKKINIKLNGNRLDYEKQKAFCDNINKLLDHQQERPKPQFISFDFASNYLCPALNNISLKYFNLGHCSFWTFSEKLPDCFLNIFTPPPQNSNLIFLV